MKRFLCFDNHDISITSPQSSDHFVEQEAIIKLHTIFLSDLCWNSIIKSVIFYPQVLCSQWKVCYSVCSCHFGCQCCQIITIIIINYYLYCILRGDDVTSPNKISTGVQICMFLSSLLHTGIDWCLFFGMMLPYLLYIYCLNVRSNSW